MSHSLPELAQRRGVIAQQIAQLGDLRPDCVTGPWVGVKSQAVAAINPGSQLMAPIPTDLQSRWPNHP